MNLILFHCTEKWKTNKHRFMKFNSQMVGLGPMTSMSLCRSGRVWL